MHRLKVSLLCLLSFTFTGAVYSQSGDPQSDTAGTASYNQSQLSLTGGVTPGPGTYFTLRHMTGDGVGYQGSYSNLGAFIPYWTDDNTILAPDIRLMLGNNSTVGGNAGLVARRYVDNVDRIFGAAAYIDVDQSSYHNTYHQATFGLETLGQYWDARMNVYYVPGTQDKFLSNGAALCVTGDPRFAGNSIVFTGQQGVLRETAMSGMDAEFGMPLMQQLSWLRFYGGMYYYRGAQVAPVMVDAPIPNTVANDTFGFRGRMAAFVSDDLKLGVQVTTDQIWGTNVNATVEFMFSGFKPTRYFPNFSTRERMLAPWERNWKVAVSQYGTAQNADVVAVNPTTGKPYFIAFVDDVKTPTPGGGDGTFENPFNSFNHPNGIAGADIIYVDRGTSTAANPYLGTMKLFDSQILVGEGGSIAPIPLLASYGACSVNGNFTLPGLDGSGNYPYVSNPNGNAVTLANNNEVTGFHIINSAGDGIFGNGVTNANLHNLDITGNAGRGINLVNTSGNAAFQNVNTSNNVGGGIFLSETNSNLNTSFLNVTANNNTGRGIDINGNGGAVTLTATDGNQSLQASGNGLDNLAITLLNNANFSGNIVGGTFNNSVNGDGILFSQSGGTGVFNVTASQLNGNGIDGIGLFGSNGNQSTISIIDSQLKQNARDGVHHVLTTVSTHNLTLDPSDISSNGRDGYHYEVSGLSTLTDTIANNLMVSNGRSAFFGLVDTSKVDLTISGITATNSGQSGFALDATNSSLYNATISNSVFSNSGANGFIVASRSGSNTALNLLGVTDNSNIQNGVAFLADNAVLTFNAATSTFSNNFANGIVGQVVNAGTTNLSVSGGSLINGNTQNGVFVTTTGLSNIIASFDSTAINNNTTGNGIRLSMTNSPASSLSLTGTTSLNDNGGNGLLVDAFTNTVFTPTIVGTSIQRNALDGIKLNVNSGSTVGTLSSAGVISNSLILDNNLNGVEVNVAGVGSTSTLVLSNDQITNTAGKTPQQIGFLYNVSAGGNLNASLGGGTTLANHAANAINGTVVGTGVAGSSTATILLDGVNASGNTQNNGVLSVSNGGFMNFTAQNLSDFSRSVNGSGMVANVSGVNSTMYVELENTALNFNKVVGFAGNVTEAVAPGVGQTGASLNVCLDGSSLSNNTLQGILVNASGPGATASFGVGTTTPGSASSVNFNGSEGVLANAINGGIVNFRSVGSHFDNNGQTVASDGLNFGGNNGTIRTLFYGGSADNNTRNGLRVGPVAPNLSTNNSDLTVSLGNGFSASNNIGYGLVMDGTGANSANLINDPNSAPIVLTGNGLGAENLNFASANQVLLQLLGSFSNSPGDGVNLTFNNITTAIVAINGLGNGTIDNNTGNGIHVTMNNVQNTAITVSGYSSISNNGLNGILLDINGSAPGTPTLAAIEIAGIPGGTLMANNQLNGVNINLLNTTLVDPFNSLPGVNLTALTLTDNDSLNACIPLAVVLPPGQGLTPTAALNITGLNVQNSGASGGTGGITVAGTDTRIVPNNTFITNNIVNGSVNGPGISVSLNETVAPTGPIASGVTISGNTVTNNNGNGITFNVTNAVPINVATADDLHIDNNIVTGNASDGIYVNLDSPAGSVTTADGMQFNGNTIIGNQGNGLDLQLSSTTVTGFTSNNMTIANNQLNGWNLIMTNASGITDGNITNASIRNNGLDGINVDASDGTASLFGDTVGGPINFTTSQIIDNGQNVVGADGLRLRLYGGSSGNIQFNSSLIGNTVPAATQTNGVDFILGSAGFPGGNLTAAFLNSDVSGNNADGILGLINGTGVAGQSFADISLSNSKVQVNNVAGIDLAVNNAGRLGLIIANNSLVDTNGSDGVHINATDANTTVGGFILDSFLTNNGQTTPPGLGNGLTGNFDSGATGNFTVTNATIGNSAVGGAQQNGLIFNVNQNAVATATNVKLDILTSTLSNNAVSGLAGNITGNNVGLNPTTGMQITLDQSTLDQNGGNGAAFLVNNGALLQMSVDNSFITGSGQNGMFVDISDAFSLAAIDMADSQLNNNGTILFPGDGFNATVANGATLNVCAETTNAFLQKMSFSGNTGDGFDVIVSDLGSRSDIDFHSVIAGASAGDGLLGNTLNGANVSVFNGGELNFRANTSHFDGNQGAGLLGSVNNQNGLNTMGRFRIIGGTADSNLGDGFSLSATNTTIIPIGVATLTAQFQADDLGTGISAQNNGGFGLNFVASNLVPPGGGIVGNLLMTGGSTLLGNGAGTLNVNMNGADQAIIGLSGTFNGSTTGDGIHIDLQNITGLALVSLQGPGEVRNNAGDGIDVSMTNVNQGGVFIGGFSDVSDNGTGLNGLIGQDGIKVTMNNVTLGAVTIDAQTATLPANIMNVSNNTGNGVNVIVNNGSVIDNTAFNGVLGANLVSVIEYIAPDAPCPTPLPNPLLNTINVNASTALGIAFTPTLAIQNLNIDNNGNNANSTGDGIVLTADTLAQIVGVPTINNNTITNTGLNSNLDSSDGIRVNILGNADVTSVDLVTNDIETNNGNGINVNANLAPTLTSLNIFNNTILNNTGGLGTSGNGIVVNLTDASALATITVDRNDVEGNNGDGFQMLNPNTGATNLAVNFTHNQFINNGSIVPPSASTTYPAGGMGIDIVLNNLNATTTTVNVLSDAQGINTISNNASFGLFLQATNQALYNLNVTGTGARNVFDQNVDAGIAIVGGSFVNPNSSLDPTKFSVGNVTIDNVNITRTILGSHPSLPNYPFSGDGIGVLMQQYAQMNSFVIGSAAARNTTLANNAGDGLRINAIEQSQFRQTLANGTTAVTPLGQATILLQQIDATGNTRNGIDIIRRDNALLSWDDKTNPAAALFQLGNEFSWQAITDTGSFIHINDVVATGNTINGLNVSTTNAQFPITRVDIIDTNPVVLTYNPKTVGHSVYDSNTGRGMQFIASADSILVVNARDTSASDNRAGGILVQTFNRATFGDVLTATPLGDPTSDNSIRSTFNGMLISGNGRANLNANGHGFEVQANGGTDPGNVSSQSVVNISMTRSATNGRNTFDSNGGDDWRITASRFSSNYFDLNRIDMRDTAFVHLNSDGLHVVTTDASQTRIDLTNSSIGYPTASSTQTGLSGDGIDALTTAGSDLTLNIGNTLALNRFGDGIAAGAADPVNAPDVSIYGNQFNGIVVRNQSVSTFTGNVFNTASRFNGNRGYSGQLQDFSDSVHVIDHSLFSDNSFEGIAIIANARSQSGRSVDIPSLFDGPSFPSGYQLYNFLNLTPATTAQFILTDSRVENNGSATPYVNSTQNVNGLEIDVSTRAYVAADIRNNTFHGNTLDDVATASFTATSGGFNFNGTIAAAPINTPGSIDRATIDTIFLEDTAQLDIRFMHNVGDQVRISSAGSNNPNMGATGAFRTDPNTKLTTVPQTTALFQVNAFHYDVVNTVTSDNVFTGTNIQPLDSNPVATVTDALNFPGPTTIPLIGPPTTAVRNLEAGLVNRANFYHNPNANPPNLLTPTAFTQVRVDNLTSGINGTNNNGVLNYTAAGQFTLAGAGSAGINAGDVIRVHLLDTNTFNQFGVAQNVEQAFNNGFVDNLPVRIPPGQTTPNSGTFFPTNNLAPYFQWPSASFPPF